MISTLASIAIIATAALLIHDDPLHKFHHTEAVKPVQVAAVQPKILGPSVLPAKKGTTTPAVYKRELNEELAALEFYAANGGK